VVLVGCGYSEADRALLKAAKKGNIEAAKQALADGADVNAKVEEGWTPLHLAAENGHKEIIELLIAKGADVNAKGRWGSTPLLLAALYGHKEVVELLISNGADVNARDFLGMILVDVAIWHSKTEEKSPQTTPPSKYQNGIKYNRSVTVTYTLL
jgi:ankyrin repeat protein